MDKVEPGGLAILLEIEQRIGQPADRIRFGVVHAVSPEEVRAAPALPKV
jgi:hypothetical protein